MHERRDEEPDRELARLVSQDALHDPGRELTHGQLDDDHRDREYERGQADHRARDGGQDHDRGIRPDDECAWKRLVVEVTVERDRPEGEQHARQHAEHRDEPEARLQMDEELGELHCEQRAYPFAHLGNEARALAYVFQVLVTSSPRPA